MVLGLSRVNDEVRVHARVAVTPAAGSR